ncbi:hypothetical protein BsWGS_12540 [Bradybaena similaris]
MFRNVFSGCVSDRSSQAEVFRSQKLKFGASLPSALKHGYLPGPLVDILVHIAREGVMTTDVFRRPGNPNDTRRIVKRLTEGKQVIYANYSFYTLASVVKKFLLKIPGGIFTPEGEEHLLQVLTIAQKVEQIESVHSFMETLTTAHQQLITMLFGTWFRIVTYQEQNCMSVEALSRSVAGSMFHTCAEDPAKVERASRIMQFLIDNFGVESMFGQDNIRFFVETTHTMLHIQELYHYVSETQCIPRRSEFIDVTRVEKEEEEDDEYEDRGIGREREFSESPQLSPSSSRHMRDEVHESQLINTSTLSAPEVSLVPSPEVSKRPKSLEDNLNEVRSHYQSRCLSRFNSVKRKQLERLRQRSDWFLSPTVRERNNSRKGKGEWGLSQFSSSSGPNGSQHRGNGNGDGKTNGGKNNNPNGSGKVLQAKNSGNSVVTKASSEGAVLEAFSDGDSVFTDNTSRSESPASEPVWSHIMKVRSRDIIHSDTGVLAPPEMSLYGGSSGADLSIDSHDNISGHHFADLSPPLVRSKLVEEEEEEEGTKGDDEDEDEDNNTPTGIQEEDDTIMASSILDLHHNSSTDKGSGCSQDSPLDSIGDSGEEAKLKRKEGGSSVRSQATSHLSVEMGEQVSDQVCQHVGQQVSEQAYEHVGQQLGDLIQGQQTTQHEQVRLEPGVEAAATEEEQQQEAQGDASVSVEQMQSSLVRQSSVDSTADS